eukprot:g42450.t1
MVNHFSQLDKYPIPHIEDLYAKLLRELSFPKLDMSHAYLQLRLDEEFQNYATINTHKGLYQYTRLRFGVTSACTLFQRTIENILQRLPQVAIYLDVELITGKTNKEHLENLDIVLKHFSQAGIETKVLDVTQKVQVEMLAKEIEKIDVLFNCA